MAVVLLITLGFLFLPRSETAIAEICANGGSYMANSTYQRNLDFLARTLPSNTSSSPLLFVNATVGQAPDAVHALALCRGDTTANVTACSTCIADAFRYVRQVCRLNRATTVYDDNCLLSFSAKDFLTGPPDIAENSTLIQFWNGENIPGDARLVGAEVHDILEQTAQLAADVVPSRFATAFMESNAILPRLYSLAQCTPDLSATDCLACLRRIIGMVTATTSVRVGGRILVMRCNFRFETNMFFDGRSMKQITPSSISSAPSVPAPASRLSRRPWAFALLVASPLAVVALCFFVYCRWQRRKYKKGKVMLWGSKRTNLLGADEQNWQIEAELSEFSVFGFNQISKATSNFGEENKLGEGRFGPVYKGKFPDGIEIVVKRLASHSIRFLEFKNEVQLIAKLQHRNLVRLLGCCSQGEEKILVYEYLPNKSLDFFIFDENRKPLLDWNKRIVIIEGIAEGLLYLHKHSRLRIIHRDLKSSNILLDSEMDPKISDFGLAKIFISAEANNTRRLVVGTYGYMAPEYASEGRFSIKSDVFSFGVLVLEILTGKRNSDSKQYGDFNNLLAYAWQLHSEGRWDEVVDATILSGCNSMEMMRCMSVALLCVQEDAEDRPTMLDVVAMLSNKIMTLADPKHPAYFKLSVGNKYRSTDTHTSSINDMTISATTIR